MRHRCNSSLAQARRIRGTGSCACRAGHSANVARQPEACTWSDGGRKASSRHECGFPYVLSVNAAQLADRLAASSASAGEPRTGSAAPERPYAHPVHSAQKRPSRCHPQCNTPQPTRNATPRSPPPVRDTLQRTPSQGASLPLRFASRHTVAPNGASYTRIRRARSAQRVWRIAWRKSGSGSVWIERPAAEPSGDGVACTR
jgi:hypothetical protein